MQEFQIEIKEELARVETIQAETLGEAIDKAMEYVRTHETAPVPSHLRDAHYKGAAKLGHGLGYQYAHDFENHYVNQQYLPDAVVGEQFFYAGDLGYEKQMKEHLQKIKAPYEKN